MHEGMEGLIAAMKERRPQSNEKGPPMSASANDGDANGLADEGTPEPSTSDAVGTGDSPAADDASIILGRGNIFDDRYMVVQKLGAGGMGIVYAAYEPRLDRWVALKLLLPERASASASARILQRAGRHDEALVLAREAFTRARDLPWPPLAAEASLRLGSLLIAEGAQTEAAAVLVEGQLGPMHPTVARSLLPLADAHAATGDHDEAKAIYERALAIQEQTRGPEHPDVVTPLLGLAEIALAQHRPTDAASLARRAVALLEERSAGSEQLVRARLLLARALGEGGDSVPTGPGGNDDRSEARETTPPRP